MDETEQEGAENLICSKEKSLPETLPLWDEGVSGYGRKCVPCGSPQSGNFESYYLWILPPRQYLDQDILFYLISFSHL